MGLAGRLSWDSEDDAKIVAAVREHGCKWRRIASLFEGRSDDAVRNRWKRVKDLPEHNNGVAVRANGVSKPHKVSSAPRPPKTSQPDREQNEDDKPERISWSRQEDEMIVRS